MLDKTRPETLNAHFQQSVDALDRTLRKYELMKRIQQCEKEAKVASHEERTRIQADIEACQKEIRRINQIDRC
jgi:hypothetical protein